jgi:mitochondrial fission protein ELM1
MSANRRRHANTLSIARIMLMSLVALLVGGAGVSYVWGKNRLHAIGTEIKQLEKRLDQLKSANLVMSSNIKKYSSTATLQDRVSSGSIQLVPIHHFESQEGQLSRHDDDAVRPVSNPSRSSRP